MNDEQPEAVVSLRNQLAKRGAASLKGLGKKFRILDDDGNKMISFEEFFKGLKECGVDINTAGAQDLFKYFDKDNSGGLVFDEFLNGIRPPMSQCRKEYIEKAFNKLDKSGDGVVTIQDLKGIYSAKEHPKYKNGEWDEKEVFEEFLKKFEEPNNPDGRVTKEEFYNYYCGVSNSIDQDIYFITMMTNCWKF